MHYERLQGNFAVLLVGASPDKPCRFEESEATVVDIDGLMRKFILSLLVLMAFSSANAEPPADWLLYRDQAGRYAFQYPPTWKVQTVPQSDSVWVTGPEEGIARFDLVFSTMPLDANVARAKFETQKARKFIVRWSKEVETGQNYIRQTGTSVLGTSVVFVLGWQPGGGLAVAYTAEAPAQVYEGAASTLATIMESFRYAPAPEQVGFVRVADSAENAFTVEVPRGWHANAELTRRGKKWGTVYLASPDYSIEIFINDGRIPEYAEPNGQLGVGARYEPIPGDVYLVKPYQTAEEFLREYVPIRIQGPLANNPEFRDRPDLAKSVHDRRAALNNKITASGADVFFDCHRKNGAACQGYAMAGTVRTPPLFEPLAPPVFEFPSFLGGFPGLPSLPTEVTTWSVDQVSGILCRPGLRNVAIKILDQVNGSFNWDPNWVANDRNRSVTNVNQWAVIGEQKVAGALAASVRNNAMMDWSTHMCSNRLLGLTDVVDPKTHQAHTIPWGPAPRTIT